LNYKKISLRNAREIQESHNFILVRQQIITRQTSAIMFKVVACRLAGKNARAISRNQATFSHSSPPGSTVRQTDAKEANQTSRLVLTTRQ